MEGVLLSKVGRQRAADAVEYKERELMINDNQILGFCQQN